MKSGFKRFLPAFMAGMFSGMARSKLEAETQGAAKPPGVRIGKAKGGGKRRGFLSGLPRRAAGGTALGMAIFQYRDNLTGRIKYGRPDEQGRRDLMSKNWHRENKGGGA